MPEAASPSVIPSRSASSLAQTQTVTAPPNRQLRRLQWAVLAVLLSIGVLAIVRLSFITGLFTHVAIDGPSMAPAMLGERYELVCADCRFAFSCDARTEDATAVCPNCGYAGNELSLDRLHAGEQVLIDRWPLLGRQPQVGEIVALQAPGDAGELAVKRIAAIGPARVSIEDGDLLIDGEVSRKSLRELRAVRQQVHDNDFQPSELPELPSRWRPARGRSVWRPAGTGFAARQPASAAKFDWLEYHHWSCSAVPVPRTRDTVVRDLDSYNTAEARELNDVHDLGVSCRVQSSRAARFAIALVDNSDRFEVVVTPGERLVVSRNGQVLVDQPLALRFDRRFVNLDVALCDRQVLVVAEGRTLVRVPYEREDAPHRDVLYPLAIGIAEGSIEVERLKVWRDIYYLPPPPIAGSGDVQLAAGEYLLLGDNQPVSHDGRLWAAGVPRSAILGRVYRPFWTSWQDRPEARPAVR